MMLHQDEATIYLADLRGCSEREALRSFHTFNHGSYFEERRMPFGNLCAINDDTLKPGCSARWETMEGTRVTLIPLVGMLCCSDAAGADHIADAGEALTFYVAKNKSFSVSNPFRGELINFLHLWEKVDFRNDHETIKTTIDFGTRNQLIPIPAEGKNPIRIGKFDGRIDASIAVKNPDHGIFAYIIEGAFEVQGRLLDSRDGLALRKSEALEFEALSSMGIILLIEAGH